MYIDAQYIGKTWPTQKLAKKYLGPFEVIAQPGLESITVQLPTYFQSVHPVFHISQLEPYFADMFPGCYQPAPKSVLVDEGDNHYKVSAILDTWVNSLIRKSCPVKYLVQWFSYEHTKELALWKCAEELASLLELV